MKIRILAALVAATIACASTAREQEPNEPAARSAVAAGQVGEPYQRLARLVGRWNVVQSIWLGHGKPPRVDAGTATFTTVLGGRHLQQELQVRSRAPLQGLGYTGFDDVAGRYYASWMDTHFTGLIVLHGEYDAASDTYSFDGTMAAPGAPDGVMPVRETMHVADSDHFVVEGFETRNGREARVLRLEYTRA